MCRSLPEAVSLEEDISTGPHKPIPIPASSKLAETFCETEADRQTVMDWRRPTTIVKPTFQDERLVRWMDMELVDM